MAKKIFITITCLFIGLSIVFYANEYKKIKAETGQSTKETTQVKKKEEPKKVSYPGKLDDWELLLVNEQHKIKEEPTNLKDLPDGHKIDSRIYDNFTAFVDGAKKAGFDLTVISAYRSVKEQEDIVERDTETNIYQGLPENEAKDKAMEYLTVPGLSEHHTGLAIDVLDVAWYEEGKTLEEDFGKTDAGKWIAENACHYGFVIRYQKGKEKITGINYEPWHIRYVGKENAEYMNKNNLVLEEYVDQLKKVGK
ncbi:MAG: M15 family metallopeptidase [Vagococcus sp.]|uniref:M15 family metallopeptidase n=1 Tax=Vagococcus sp. TaxID=1933889 RepID=UPI002FCC3749